MLIEISTANALFHKVIMVTVIMVSMVTMNKMVLNVSALVKTMRMVSVMIKVMVVFKTMVMALWYGQRWWWCWSHHSEGVGVGSHCIELYSNLFFSFSSDSHAFYSLKWFLADEEVNNLLNPLLLSKIKLNKKLQCNFDSPLLHIK